MDDKITWYGIYDRLSRRHKWQVVSYTADVERKDILTAKFMDLHLRWIKMANYPGYEIGVRVDEFSVTASPDYPADLPANFVMKEVTRKSEIEVRVR